jgi:Ca2+-binding RTX toxin-like protein
MACRAWLSRNPPLYQDFFLDVGVRITTSARPEVGRRLALDASLESQLFSFSEIDPASVSAHLVGTGADPLSIFAVGNTQPDALRQPIAEVQVDASPSGAAGTTFGYSVLNLNYLLTFPGGGSTAASCSPVTPPATVLSEVVVTSPTTCKGYAPTIVGTANDDVIIGTSGDDVIQAGSGDDVVFGLGGHDRICGSHGDDVILGGSGEDRLYGEGGRDVVRGGADHDWVHGGGATDTCSSASPVSCESFFS